MGLLRKDVCIRNEFAGSGRSLRRRRSVLSHENQRSDENTVKAGTFLLSLESERGYGQVLLTASDILVHKL